ncbi:MAG: aminomethyl-transferring glycine dehydrogenase subunit GcvPA [Cyanobacteria bacterium SIG30]|nr:aminomethyl-transferring glycine dehydrogenase subunit GcvPA [Cyanobacteria bacterium SIG30]
MNDILKNSQEMLEAINLATLEDLFSQIPDEARVPSLNLEDAKDELEVQKIIEKIAKKNKNDYIYFLGGGSYKKFIPPAISAISQRFEFLSAYTPYQAEISQGTLKTMYDFQTMICKITNQDVSNASVYDGASACAEAILMTCRINKRNKAFVSSNINPNYLEVIKTYLWASGIELVVGEKPVQDDELACVLYQSPNYYGELEEMPQKNGKELIISCVDLSSLALFEPPNSDITVGDFQVLGIPMAFGGPYGGFVACKDAYKRQLPGRVVGKTVDKEGKEAFVLTLQAREQHIRREKATSNICSNQALVALCATVYMDLMGENGFIKVSQKSYDLAHKLAQSLKEKGYNVLSNNFFNEFVFEVKNADEFLENMRKNGILAGIKISDNKILTATTEMNDDDDIKAFLNNL